MYLYDEAREIKSISVGIGEEGSYYEVGRNNAWMKKTPTKIVAELVCGEMCNITWFAVYEGEKNYLLG